MKFDKRSKLEKAVSKNDDPTDIKTKVFIGSETAKEEGYIAAYSEKE